MTRRPAAAALTLFLGAGLSGVAVAAAGGAQNAPSPNAPPTATAMRANGRLDDAAWNAAPPVDAFVQREPREGAPPTLRTEARVAYDDDALYVTVRAHDPEPDRIRGFLTRRDAGSASDWIRVIVDSYHDRRTAYEFAVNPAGVKQDLYRFNDNEADDSWDAVWDVVVARDASGWRAEFRIPYSQLRFSTDGDGRLGFAVVRYMARLDETATWPLLPISASGYVSSFGELAGVVTRVSKRLELVPYSVAQVQTAPRQDGNPLHQGTDPGVAVGADVKYAVTQALSLTATVNPDFGQVEADPAVVNLSAFETFFSERRPFFIEGSGTYQFGCNDGCNLFYSRRIGRQPRGAPSLADGEYAAQPSQSTILGAGKLTGRIGRFSVGVLTAATQEEVARIAFGSNRRSEVVEPQSFYSVSRARREFADRSSVGFMLTTANRRLADSVSFLPNGAMVGGVDYDWRLGERWNLAGYWAGSSVHGSREAISLLQRSNVHSYQRPDAAHVELDPEAEALRGHSGSVSLGKIGGERTRVNLSLMYRSPGFDVNDVGFLRRADEITQRGWVQIRWDTPGKYVRNTRLNFNQWSLHNFDGDRLEFGGNINAHWSFQNNWNAGFGVNTNVRSFDDRRTRGGPGAYFNPNASSWQYFSTDNRRLVSVGWDSDFGTDGHGGSFGLSPNVTVRPTEALSTELRLSFNKSKDDAQWVGAVADADVTRYVFGRLDQTTTSFTTRVNYTLTPNLSLQLYAQPFVSAGNYDRFLELANGRALRFANRYTPFAYDGDPDFTVLSFRTTNVLRWEFKPGSTMFVVWQQGREGFAARGDFGFRRDYRDVFSSPSTNTVLVKLAYWLNP